jgi:hypothetical protein
MRLACFLIVLAAFGQEPARQYLAVDGIWMPQRVADIAPAAGVPFLPWAKAKFQENSGKQSETDARCLPSGVPRIMLQARPLEIVPAPGRIMFLYEGGSHVWRQVWMDGRPHPKDPNPDWLGHSIGHWGGDTLVVDTVGFNDKTWLDDAGHPHTEQLHVIEKFTKTGLAAMKYEVVIDDPGTYSRSWSTTSSLVFRAGEKLAEDICLDK